MNTKHARKRNRGSWLLVLALTAGITGAGEYAALSGRAQMPVSGAVVRVHVPAERPPVVTHPRHPKPAERLSEPYVTVRRGDCLWVIARRHHVGWVALYRANRKTVGPNPNLIYAGERLKLP